ncbi:MAG: redoxin domain-containing protein [Candidatus Lokiarchaeota archaeon]|nr:redoxin domain-containing protein [Candidatus Lokiarchaeota archaeon]
MGRLAARYDDFQSLDTELYPILVDKIGNAKKMEEKYAKGKFPIYYDEEKNVSKLLKQEVKILKLGRMPGLLIIDKEGVIQYAYYSSSMKDIPKNNDVIAVIEEKIQ